MDSWWHNNTLAILIIIVLGAAGFVYTNNARNDLCHFTQKSFVQRREIVKTLTAHSALSKDVDKNSSQGRALQSQIDHANARKDGQRAHLIRLGGAPPSC